MESETTIIAELKRQLAEKDAQLQQEIAKRQQLEQESRSLSLLLDTTGAECFIKDKNGIYQYINRAYEQQFGVRREKVVGKDDVFVFGPETAAMLRENDQRIMDGGKTESIEESTWIEDAYVTYLTTKTPLFDEQNQVLGICGAGIDITEKKRLEYALVASEQLHRNLVEQISDALLTLEVDGTIQYISPAVEAILGYTPEEMMGLTVFDFIGPDEYDIARNRLRMLSTGELPGFDEYQALTKQGEKRWIRISSQPIEENGRITGIHGVMTDIHDRKIAAEQLEQAAVLAERERLARDLHDAVTQSLFMATATAEALPRVWEQNPERAQQALKELRLLTRGALAEMRSLLLELRPTSFSEQSLATLLRQLTDGLAARSRMLVTTTAVGECHLRDEIKMALYRITQEALNNTIKHAEASRALVSLQCEGEQLLLRIKDDGKGFDHESVVAHFGLENMQARACDIGADIRFESSPGDGTEIAVTWQPDGNMTSVNLA